MTISTEGFLRGQLKMRIVSLKKTIATRQKKLKSYETQLAKLNGKKRSKKRA